MEQFLLKFRDNLVFLDLNYEDTETPVFYQADRVRAMVEQDYRVAELGRNSTF